MLEEYEAKYICIQSHAVWKNDNDATKDKTQLLPYQLTTSFMEITYSYIKLTETENLHIPHSNYNQ